MVRRRERVARGLCGYCSSGRRLAKGSKSRCRTCLRVVDAANRRNPNWTPEQALMRGIRHKTSLPMDAIRAVWAGRYDHCEICAIAAKDTPQRVLSFDHDHATGAFRGWLCQRCNITVGFIERHRRHLPATEAYLRRNEKPAANAPGLTLVRSA